MALIPTAMSLALQPVTGLRDLAAALFKPFVVFAAAIRPIQFTGAFLPLVFKLTPIVDPAGMGSGRQREGSASDGSGDKEQAHSQVSIIRSSDTAMLGTPD